MRHGLSPIAMWNTVRLSIEAGFLVVPPGLLIGFLLERRRWLGRGFLSVTLWAVFLMPSYLLTSGWQILVAMPVLADSHISRLFYGEAGIVFLLTIKGLAFSAMSARTGWHVLGEDLEAASRMHVRTAWRRWWLIARLLFPIVGSMMMVQMVAASQDFGVAATLGAQVHLPLVSYVIYQNLSTIPVDFSRAALLSLFLVCLALLALGAQAMLGRSQAATIGGRQHRPVALSCRPVMLALAWLLTGSVFLAGVGAPQVALAVEGMSGPAVHGSLVDAGSWRAISLSLRYGFVSAVAAVLLAAIILGGRMRSGKGGAVLARLLLWLTSANMAVPGVILGASYLIAFNGGMLALYGTPMLLLLAYTASHLPVALRFLDAPFASLHRGLGEAARVHGLSLSERLEGIYLPLLIRPLSWAWAMVFITVFFELPLSEILYPAGTPPLAVRLLSLGISQHYEAQARVALVGMVTCLAVTCLGLVLVPFLAGPTDGTDTTFKADKANGR
ncbi:ABC transporter permease [Acetobacter orleanensis]|nr:hypothetical protein [Acetobacter orleanensis]